MDPRVSIRVALVDDAPAIQTIYAPIVCDTAISFEDDPPSVEEMTARVRDAQYSTGNVRRIRVYF
jgi:L-amino acid N-acyltransferase YncA